MGVQIWSIRSPDGGSTGLEFARAQLDEARRVLIHAAPSEIDVEIVDSSGRRVASAKGLKESDPSPMALLTVDGDRVGREQIWPSAAELELPVILPGGEVGLLTAWWNSDDRREWRWSVEFSNRR